MLQTLTLQDQFDAGEQRISELEGELAAAQEKLALLEDEKRSLQLAAVSRTDHQAGK